MLIQAIRGVLRDEKGATMVEYAIMVSFIAAICVAVVSSIGKATSNEFSSLNTSF
jgi:Flp pilus assembly pilin Flp